MGLVNTQLFVGTRCRLARHRDARFVNGWVQYFRGESLVVTTEDALGSEPGDTFFVEAFGPKAKACMEAVLKAVDADASVYEQAEGQAAPLAKLTLHLKGHLQVHDNAEASRVLVEGVYATVSVGGGSSKAEVRDISTTGIGLLLEVPVQKGDELDMTVDTMLGPIAAKGVVRHVRQYRGKYRAGVQLTGFSRLDGSRWRKLLGEAA
jgi:hypothetical protein